MAQEININEQNVSDNGTCGQSFKTDFTNDPERYWEGRDYTKAAASEAWRQILQSLAMHYGAEAWGVMASWGVSKKAYLRWRDMPALALHVQGFAHTGWIIISLNEGADVYEAELTDELFIAKEGSRREEVYCDELGAVIDEMVETGGLSKAEYDAKIKQEYPDECWAKEHGVQVVYVV